MYILRHGQLWSTAALSGVCRTNTINTLTTLHFPGRQQFSQLSDLEGAIAQVQESMMQMSKEHPRRHFTLSNLGSFLSTRYLRVGPPGDLEEAILLLREALSLWPE